MGENIPLLVKKIFEGSQEARKIVSEHAYRTPVEYSHELSRLTGGKIHLKLENLQKTGSFKIRGALYKVSKLAGSVSGIVTASAGNHAQGVAYASSVFGLPCIVVMPESASITKIEAVKNFGAEVILHGKIYDDSEQKAIEIAEERGYAFIHPFDDPDVISGQGTIAWEMVEQISKIDTVIVPLGGGGLISGISTVMKIFTDSVEIIGVEPENVPKFAESMRLGKITVTEVKPTIADGLATKRPGKNTFRIVKSLVDEIVTVNEDEIARAIHYLLEKEKVLAEGAGAAGVAALLGNKVDVRGKNVAVVISGGNIDLTAIYKLIIRALANSGKLAVIYGFVPDSPGNLSEVTGIIARHRGNIIDVIHHREDLRAPAWHTALKIVFEVESSQVVENILAELESRGYHFKKM
ncbi:threonine ammonia-lyase [Geoglobus acetivorans]|uniref:threonine ammonia-lyase n=1 Tax=Geoglobus acetivorans TaxID=565033 RepID=A0ABZ3H5B8_GEOAI